MRVDIWSDIVCPWCYVGKRRFERGLATLGDPGDFEIIHRAFQLNPSMPKGEVAVTTLPAGTPSRSKSCTTRFN